MYIGLWVENFKYFQILIINNIIMLRAIMWISCSTPWLLWNVIVLWYFWKYKDGKVITYEMECKTHISSNSPRDFDHVLCYAEGSWLWIEEAWPYTYSTLKDIGRILELFIRCLWDPLFFMEAACGLCRKCLACRVVYMRMTRLYTF